MAVGGDGFHPGTYGGQRHVSTADPAQAPVLTPTQAGPLPVLSTSTSPWSRVTVLHSPSDVGVFPGADSSANGFLGGRWHLLQGQAWAPA